MRAVVVVIAAGVLLSGGVARSAVLPQKDVATEKAADLVTVAGCVYGDRFKPARDSLIDLPATVTGATEWKLLGKKELLPDHHRSAREQGMGDLRFLTPNPYSNGQTKKSRAPGILMKPDARDPVNRLFGARTIRWFRSRTAR